MATDASIPATMSAVRLHPPGGIEAVTVDKIATPTPSRGEVLVRVHAAALTRDELGWPVDRLPAVPSYELSGTVVEADDSTFESGQSVYGMTDFGRDGVAAEYATVNVGRLSPKPESLSHGAAAAFPLPALSAFQGLFDHGRLIENERILVHGGAGGVGAYAVQLARLYRAYVITTTSANRVEMARWLGAHEVIDHTASDFTTIEPVDLVFDTVGGERLARSVDVLEPGGRLVSVAEDPPLDATAEAGIEAKWYLVESRQDQLVQLARLADLGRLRVLVDQTYRLVEARDAFRHLQQRGGTGKIVLTVVDEAG